MNIVCYSLIKLFEILLLLYSKIFLSLCEASYTQTNLFVTSPCKKTLPTIVVIGTMVFIALEYRISQENEKLNINIFGIELRHLITKKNLPMTCCKKNETETQNFITRIQMRLSIFFKLHCIHLPFVYYWLNFQIK